MANNRIAVRRTSTAAKVPSTSDINTGELGLNMTDQVLYSHNGSTVFAIGNNLPTQHVGTNLYVGNSTVNAAINSTAIVIGNGSVNTLVVNTYISGNGFGLTSVTASASPGGSNTQVQFNDSSTTAGDANLTWTKTTSMLTIGNSSVNVAANTTSVVLGNVGGTISVSSPTIMIGNSSQNATINSTSFVIGNVGGALTVNTATVIIGNSTVNAVINSTAIVIGNGSVNTFVVNTYISGNGYGLTSIGGGTPGGANTQLQYNNSGSFAASPNLTFNYGTAVLAVGNATGSGADGHTVINTTACFSTGNVFYMGVTGDQYGNVSLILKNRDFWNGAMFKNENMPLVDMMFGTSNGTAANCTVRFETRAAGGIYDSRNADSGEIEIGQVTTSNWYIVMGNGAIICKSTIPFSANVPLDSGLASNSLGIYVKAGNGIAIDTNGTRVVAGNSTIISNTSGIFVNATAAPAGANTQIQYNSSGTMAGDANLSWAGALCVGNATVNVTANTTSVRVGNATLYTFTNSTTMIVVDTATIGNGSINSTVIAVGNSVLGVAANSSSFRAGNVTLYSLTNQTSLSIVDTATIGNGTINSTAISVGNSTVNVAANNSSVRIGNGTVYTIANSSAELFVDTATVGNCISNSSTISVGNSLSNVVITSASAIATKNTASVYNFGAPPSKSVDVLSPASGDSYTMFWTNAAIVISEIVTVIQNSAAAWANVGFYWGSSRAAANATINSTANSANNTTGTHITAFSNATILANNFIWANVNANSAPGPTEFHATIRFV